jgi:hypothetical protein
MINHEIACCALKDFGHTFSARRDVFSMSIVRPWGCVSFHSRSPSALRRGADNAIIIPRRDEKFAWQRVNKKARRQKMPKEVCVLLHLIVAIFSPWEKVKRYFWIFRERTKGCNKKHTIIMLLLRGFKSGWVAEWMRQANDSGNVIYPKEEFISKNGTRIL